MKSLEPWRTLNSELLLDRQPWALVFADTLELPDGQVVEGYLRFQTPSYVMTAAVHENGSFGLVRSYKRGLDGIDVQPPAGIVDPGEIPLDTAKRELLEELGCEASVWHALGEYITDGNFGMSRAYFFLAEGCRETRTPEPGDLEEQQVLWLSREQVWESWSHGAFHQLSTMACLGVAFAHLDGRLDGPAGFAPSAPGEK